MEVPSGVAAPQVRRPGVHGLHVSTQHGHCEVHVLRSRHRAARRRHVDERPGAVHLGPRQVHDRRPHQLGSPVGTAGDRRADHQEDGEHHGRRDCRGGTHTGSAGGHDQAHHRRQRKHPQGPPGHGVGLAGRIQHVEHTGGHQRPEHHHRPGQEHHAGPAGAHHRPCGERCGQGHPGRQPVTEHHPEHGDRLRPAVQESPYVQ